MDAWQLNVSTKGAIWGGREGILGAMGGDRPFWAPGRWLCLHGMASDPTLSYQDEDLASIGNGKHRKR